MTHAHKNFSFKDPECSDGDVFEFCNLSQLVPHTAICAGRTGLTFRSCNLCNCAVPAESVVEDCMTAQVSRCSHLNPQLVERGLPECDVNCVHVESVDEIVVDGVVVETIYHRKDVVV